MSFFNLVHRQSLRAFQPIFERLQRSSLGMRLASGTFWSVLGAGVAKMITLIAMVFVARILGKESFGEFGLVRSTATVFLTFSSFGMGLTATKQIATLLQSDKVRTGRIIALSYLLTLLSSLIVSLVFYLAVPWLCETKLQAPHLTETMKLGAVVLFLSTFMTVQTSVMAGFQDFKGLAWATFLSSLFIFPLYLIGAWYDGIRGAVIAVAASIGLNVLANSIMIYRNIKRFQIHYSFLHAYKELPLLWHSNIPIVLNGMIQSIALWVSHLMLVKCTGGTEELGVYYAVMYFQFIILFIPQVVLTAFFPIMNELIGNKEMERYWSTTKKVSLLNFGVALLCSLPFLLFPKPFITLFGPQYTENWSIVLVVCLSAILGTFSSLAYQVFMSHGKFWLSFFLNLFGVMIYLLGVAFLLHIQWGAYALFGCQIFSGCLYLLIFYLYFNFLFPRNCQAGNL